MTSPSPSTGGAFDVCTGVDPRRIDTEDIDLLGRPVQKLVQLIKELEQLGVEARNLPLPKIIVVGDQSAGKSSLIEGISGIKVPRSDGTCTRCPLEITLYSSQDTAWSCEVSLQQKFSFDPNASTDGRYGKWHEDHTPTTIRFATVTNKTDLTGIISRAQWATLNPGDDPKKYLNADIVEALPLAVEFAPNKVILDLTAPGQPSLSFIDLPGVIRQMTTHKDQWLVKLVENFVADHIKQGNSLILLARSMESDFANSSGAALIDQCNGAIDRTVGCLTKPDRWPPGSRTQSIQSVLRGDAFAVGHGYFITKQPDQLELNGEISSAEARRNEMAFFAQMPWSTELADFQDCFGTFKLRDTLSVKLTKQILVTLPRISKTVNAHLEEIETELAGYPDPPENALGKVLEALNVFRNSVEKHSQGIHPHNELRNSLKELNNTFHVSLHKLRPGLIVATPEKFRQAIDIPTFSLLSDDDEFGGTPCPSSSPSTGGKKTFRLLDVRDTLSKLTASGVPGEYIDAVKEEVQTTLDQLLEEACALWLNTAFFTEAKKIIKGFVSKAMLKQLEHAKRALTLEQRKPLTLNAEGFKHHHDRELKILLEGRTTARLVEKLENTDRAAGRIIVEPSERKKKAKTDQKARADLPDDPFGEEIKVIAKVRGYHDVALLRFLDHVVQGVEVEVLYDLENNLPQQLKAGLEVETRDAQDRCKELLAEDGEREIHRKTLHKERANFIMAQQKLARIGEQGENIASFDQAE
ncbi:hypothetical protein AUEXF2481DRAFT_66902 [Aureobasidium subglaciale EXF-2481]|uniref:GED domain-containing protein n=1 Tax=Aureobasidium subglaciale (strain EXF-2481) TaxID=1043005 RepID=A0A074YIR6_AURSE|nr:uncharacterized protein AUEXF2481DRAFT_66902 [Aureobasidium subglaciale EXF-2481]KEQ93982.1 hypothetical protein AUEXF2481DRAFT_66902 [Aureobasidium subglaciale EXF-2481]